MLFNIFSNVYFRTNVKITFDKKKQKQKKKLQMARGCEFSRTYQ